MQNHCQDLGNRGGLEEELGVLDDVINHELPWFHGMLDLVNVDHSGHHSGLGACGVGCRINCPSRLGGELHKSRATPWMVGERGRALEDSLLVVRVGGIN